MEDEEAYEWASVLAQLAGQREAAYMYPPYRRALGDYGTPRVKGANQVGTTLLTDGWPAGYVFKFGSWLHYETGTFRMLHTTTATAIADGSGNMSIPVRHAIRKSPPDNALLTLERPSCEMVLAVPDVDLLELADACVYGVSIDFKEDVKRTT